jgi:hypothetical protein
MGRPPLPVGTFGQIHFLKLDKHRVAARTYYRDLDGRHRLVTPLRPDPCSGRAAAAGGPA